MRESVKNVRCESDRNGKSWYSFVKAAGCVIVEGVRRG